MMADLGIAEIRAEGRKMLAKYRNANGGSTDEAKAVELWFWGWVDELLRDPEGIDEDGVDHICDALIEVGPWDEIDGDGTEASIIADHIRDLGRLPATPLSEGEVEKLTVENRALRELVEWALRMIDGHASDLQGLRESVSEQATKIALDRLVPSPPPGEPEPDFTEIASRLPNLTPEDNAAVEDALRETYRRLAPPPGEPDEGDECVDVDCWATGQPHSHGPDEGER